MPAVFGALLCGGFPCAWGQGPFPNRPDPYSPAGPPTGFDPGIRVANVPPPVAPVPGQNIPLPPIEPEFKKFEPGLVVARVGNHTILYGDVQPMVRQMLEPYYAKAKTAVEKQQLEEQRLILEQQITRQLIDGKLMYMEFERKVPKDKKAEVESKIKKSFEKELSDARDKIAEFINEPKKVQEFVKKNPTVYRLAYTMEEKHLTTAGELDQDLRRHGSSLEQQIRFYGEQNLGRSVMAKEIDFKPVVTHEEMLDYFHEHSADYEFPAKAKWEVLMVRKDRYRSRDAAFQAMSAMGNQIFLGGAQFAAVAKASSQGFDADKGGAQDWTSQGALASKVLDQAIFSLPEGKLSQILEDERGLYIVRVVERKPAGRTPFEDAQAEIKLKIQDQKKEAQFKEYLEKLRTNTKVWTIYDAQQGQVNGG